MRYVLCRLLAAKNMWGIYEKRSKTLLFSFFPHALVLLHGLGGDGSGGFGVGTVCNLGVGRGGRNCPPCLARGHAQRYCTTGQ